MAMILTVEEVQLLKPHVDDAELSTSWHSPLCLGNKLQFMLILKIQTILHIPVMSFDLFIECLKL